MALFVDGPINSIDDLTDEDSGLLDAAQTCGINVSKKLRLAWEEINADLYLWLEKPRPAMQVVCEPTLKLDQIVATEPLRRWERMSALANMYRDAYFNQLVDRYQHKWDEYGKLRREAREVFIAAGLDLVTNPIRRANPPVLGMIAGAGTAGMFYASAAWVDAHGNEGQASEASSITLIQSQLMVVSAVAAPANTAGFNVYAGPTPDSMMLQNSFPLPVGSSYTYIPGSVSGGRAPAAGQASQFKRRLTRTLLRG